MEIDIAKYINDEKDIIKEINKYKDIIYWDRLSEDIPLKKNILLTFNEYWDWKVISERLICHNKLDLFDETLHIFKKKFEFSFLGFSYNIHFIEKYFDDIHNIDNIPTSEIMKFLEKKKYWDLDNLIKNTIIQGNYDIDLVKYFATRYTNIVTEILQHSLKIKYLEYYLMSPEVTKKLYLTKKDQEYILNEVYPTFVLNGRIALKFELDLIYKKFGFKYALSYLINNFKR